MVVPDTSSNHFEIADGLSSHFINLKVYILSSYPAQGELSVPEWLLRHSHLDSHELTDDPAEANLILFAEVYDGLDPYFLDVVRHPIFRRFPNKCVLYHINDTTETMCRTVSPSVESTHLNARCRRSFSYVVRVHENPWRSVAWDRECSAKFLFSFVGDPSTHPVREQILKLHHPEALLRPAIGISAMGMDTVTREAFQKRYIEEILDSCFVLCPRGLGPTSMRLFEAMEMGRAPVVIGDSWLPVARLPWDEFALFVPEKDIDQIPIMLEKNRHRAVVMGRKARSVWEEHFSPKRVFGELIATAAELLREPYGRRERWKDIMMLSHPNHWRNLLGWWRRRLTGNSSKKTEMTALAAGAKS